jgi:hypothetical protein
MNKNMTNPANQKTTSPIWKTYVLWVTPWTTEFSRYFEWDYSCSDPVYI